MTQQHKEPFVPEGYKLVEGKVNGKDWRTSIPERAVKDPDADLWSWSFYREGDHSEPCHAVLCGGVPFAALPHQSYLVSVHERVGLVGQHGEFWTAAFGKSSNKGPVTWCENARFTGPAAKAEAFTWAAEKVMGQ